MDGKIQAGLAAAGATALGAAGQGVVLGRAFERMDAQVRADCHALVTAGYLPQVQPLFPLTPRQGRSRGQVMFKWIGGTGFAFWAVTYLLTVVLIAPHEGLPMAILGSLLPAFIVGVLGLIVGAFIAAGATTRETTRQLIDAEVGEFYRAYWQDRLRGGQALAEMRATPHQVAEVLSQYIITDPSQGAQDPYAA